MSDRKNKQVTFIFESLISQESEEEQIWTVRSRTNQTTKKKNSVK